MPVPGIAKVRAEAWEGAQGSQAGYRRAKARMACPVTAESELLRMEQSQDEDKTQGKGSTRLKAETGD